MDVRLFHKMKCKYQNITQCHLCLLAFVKAGHTVPEWAESLKIAR